jgi:hypothetical protein
VLLLLKLEDVSRCRSCVENAMPALCAAQGQEVETTSLVDSARLAWSVHTKENSFMRSKCTKRCELPYNPA